MYRLIVLLGLAACVLGHEVFALNVGDTAPCVVLKDLQPTGEVKYQCIRNKDNPSQKYTLLEFSVPDCEACEKNIVELACLGIEATTTIRMVVPVTNEKAIDAFVQKFKTSISFSVAYDTKLAALKSYGVGPVPVLFILDEKNVVVYKHVGVITNDVRNEIIDLVK